MCRAILALCLVGASSPLANASISSNERSALVALYNTTGGSAWANREGWLGAAGTECTWYGITCDEQKSSIAAIGLDGNHLTGSLPPELGLLVNLRTLDLGENEIGGAIPVELRGLTAIETLNLFSNRLSGPIPAELGALTTLRHLDLDANQLSGPIPPQLGALRNLEFLDLGANSLGGTIPPELTAFEHLRVFAIYLNDLEGAVPDGLWRMTSLEEIWLSGNRLTGSIAPAVGGLVNLRYLVGWNNHLSGRIPDELTTLATLTVVSLSANDLQGPLPEQIGNLRELQLLYLDGNPLNGTMPESMRNLQKLEELDLSATKLTGEVPTWLPELKSLTYLALHGNDLGGVIPVNIGDLQRLTHLDLGTNHRLGGTIPSSLWRLTKLQFLDLGSFGEANAISGSLAPEVGNLLNLETLELGNTRLSGRIPAEVGNLTKLQLLSLQIAEFSGPIPNTIGNLTGLQYLFLDFNELSGVVPAALWRLKNLRTLSLGYNHLEGTLPADIGAMADLETLWLQSNRFSGPLPQEIGDLTKLEELDISANAFRGLVPHEITKLTALFDGFGLDIGENALAIDDQVVRDFVFGKDSLSAGFPTQTLTPLNVHVTESSDRTVTIAWDKVAYAYADGGIQVIARTAPDAPIAAVATTDVKSDTSLVVRNLDSSTTYFFTANEITYPYFSQQNLLIGDPSATVSATTAARIVGPPHVEQTENPRGLVQIDAVPQNEDRVVLKNFGDRATAITLNISADFITAAPTTFSLDAGASQTIVINSLPKPAGAYSGYIIAEGEGAGNFIWITLLSVSKPSDGGTARAEPVDSRIELAGVPGSDSVGQARFRNVGTTELAGMLVSDQPWLVPDPFQIFIAPGLMTAINFRVVRARRPPGAEGALSATLSLIYIANPFAKRGALDNSSGVSVTKVTVVDVAKPDVSSQTIPPVGSDVAYFLAGVGTFQREGTSFVSDISLLNNSDAAALANVRLYYTPAAAAQTMVATLGTIPGSNSVTLANVVANVYGAASQVGSIQIRSADWQNLVVQAKLLGFIQQGTVAASIPTFRSDRSALANDPLYLVGVRKTQTLRTDLYVQETAGTKSAVTIDFVDAQGSPAGERRDASVDAFAMVEVLDAAPQNAATAIVTNRGTGRIAAYARVSDSGTGENWTSVDWSHFNAFKLGAPMRVPFVDGGASGGGTRRRAVPHAEHGRTELMLFNPTKDAAAATIEVDDANGNATETRVEVPAGQSVALPNIGGSARTPNAQAVITPIHEAKLVAAARTVRGSGSSTTIPVIAGAAGLRNGRSQIFSNLEDATAATVAAAVPGTYRTSFGLIESGGGSVVVRARIFLDEGRSLASSAIYRDFSLAPGQQIIVDELVRGVIGASRDTLDELHNLQLRIEVVGGSGSVVPFVIITDNATGAALLRQE